MEDQKLENLIRLDTYPVNTVLDILLKDRATGKNIIWATKSYQDVGDQYSDRFSITREALLEMNQILIQPRVLKAQEHQLARTKAKAEVFTPSWICNKMINVLDEEWFGQPNLFNTEIEIGWQTNPTPIPISKGKWKDYIKSTRLEITCGEAPFIVSRYDASTGEIIPVENRIGMLDRKLRVINEQHLDRNDWEKAVLTAYKSVYGYEFQGDNLLIGRINLLNTYVDNCQYVWNENPAQKNLEEIANIISWNIWQMDGLTQTVPLGAPQKNNEQMTFDLSLLFGEEVQDETAPLSIIKDWKTKKNTIFQSIGKEQNMAKFDFCIGNPPYQDETTGKQKKYAPPVYNLFMDETYKIGEAVELVHPARFLFNAGATPSEWNQKILNDPHFKVQGYIPNSATLFANTDIKGGIAISYHDKNKEFKPVKIFTSFIELNSILKKVMSQIESNLESIISGRGVYKLSEKAITEVPEIIGLQSKGHTYDVGSGAFKILKDVIYVEHIV